MFIDSNTARDFRLNPVIDNRFNDCNACSLCTSECAFLSKYGDPGTIFKNSKKNPDIWQKIAFECSLCGLCSRICPKHLDIPGMILDLRQEAVKNKNGHFDAHKRILGYEKKGTSKKYTYYSLPENCDTIFFPGCTLPGTHRSSTIKAFEYLKNQVKNIGIVLDCCTKPSHDLGQQTYFNAMFSEMKAYLIEHHIKNIIVACPSCYQIFKKYGNEFNVKTIYEIMAQKGIKQFSPVKGEITIHDPCQTRFESHIHDSVRSLVKKTGLDIVDTKHCRSKTLCCGRGGSACFIEPEIAAAWTDKRIKETGNKKMATYCAGCVSSQLKKTASFHILDLIFNPQKAMNGKAKISKAPFTYLNRLKLKKSLKSEPASVKKERDFSL